MGGAAENVCYILPPLPPSVFWYRCMLIVSVIPGNAMTFTFIFSRTTPNLGEGTVVDGSSRDFVGIPGGFPPST